MTPLQELQHFPLERAWLCAQDDCRTVSNSRGICPKCGGASGEYIVRWLDRLTRNEGAGIATHEEIDLPA